MRRSRSLSDFASVSMRSYMLNTAGQYSCIRFDHCSVTAAGVGSRLA